VEYLNTCTKVFNYFHYVTRKNHHRVTNFANNNNNIDSPNQQRLPIFTVQF